jgi:GcrA cell cycle regulator
LSASQIAAQLGGVSRNAVIGKVHRLKLSSRGRATAAPARQKKAAKPIQQTVVASKQMARSASSGVASRPMAASIGATALQVQYDVEAVAQVVVRPQSQNVVVPISRRLALTELTERTCKWPNGDPLSEEFNFCGNEVCATGPYCQYHSRLAYQPVSDRKRAR